MAQVFALRRLSTLVLRQRRQRLLRQLQLPPNLIRASIVERFNTCGKPNCACARGQKHGPFYYLTQCLAAGKVNKFLLKTSASQDAARAWGPLTTPEVFALDSDLRLRYRGAPDADYDDPSQDASWLRAALDALLSGGVPEPAETKPVGCSVKWKE